MGVATWKWLTLTVDILAYEAAHRSDGMLLSEEAHRWVDSRPIAARVAIISAGALLTAHLAKVLDPRYDVISREFCLRNRCRR